MGFVREREGDGGEGVWLVENARFVLIGGMGGGGG